MKKHAWVAVVFCAVVLVGVLLKDARVATAHHYTITSCNGDQGSGWSYTITYTDTSRGSITEGPFYSDPGVTNPNQPEFGVNEHLIKLVE